MAEANQTVLNVLNHLNSKIGTGGGGVVDSGGSDGNSSTNVAVFIPSSTTVAIYVSSSVSLIELHAYN